MRKAIRTGLVAALVVGWMGAGAAVARPIFFDDFESGLGRWTGKSTSYAAVITDPESSGNSVLSFSNTNTAGDIFSDAISVSQYQDIVLTYDYLGLTSPIGGGIIGFNDGTLSGLTPPTNWIASHVGNGSYPDVHTDDGAWDSYSVTFNTGKYTSIRLVIEDWQGASGYNAHFDNVRLTVVPLPSAAWMGLGLLAVLGAARRRRR